MEAYSNSLSLHNPTTSIYLKWEWMCDKVHQCECRMAYFWWAEGWVDWCGCVVISNLELHKSLVVLKWARQWLQQFTSQCLISQLLRPLLLLMTLARARSPSDSSDIWQKPIPWIFATQPRLQISSSFSKVYFHTRTASSRRTGRSGYHGWRCSYQTRWSSVFWRRHSNSGRRTQ